MDKDWLKHGAPADGIDWRGPDEPEVYRAMVDPHHQLKQIWFLERAVMAAQSVARVALPDGGFASCFLVAPNLILTNHHVFGVPEDVEGAVIQFRYRARPDGTLPLPDETTCDPATFVTEAALDFTLVGLTSEPNIPPLPLQRAQTLEEGSHVSIIQHPGGAPQQVAIRDNALAYFNDDLIQYITNTDYGSSGSPVFNTYWEVIALHSRRVPDPSQPGAWYRNQGFRITRILEHPDVDPLIPHA